MLGCKERISSYVFLWVNVKKVAVSFFFFFFAYDDMKAKQSLEKDKFYWVGWAKCQTLPQVRTTNHQIVLSRVGRRPVQLSAPPPPRLQVGKDPALANMQLSKTNGMPSNTFISILPVRVFNLFFITYFLKFLQDKYYSQDGAVWAKDKLCIVAGSQ